MNGRLATALAVVVATLLIAACGDTGDASTSTTTVTSSGEGTAVASTTSQGESTASGDATGGEPRSTTGSTSTSAPATTATTGEATPSTAPTTGQPLASTTTTPTDQGGTSLPPSAPAAPLATPSATVGGESTGAVLSRPFSTASPWNTQVLGDPADPKSRQLMKRAQVRIAQVERPDGRITAVTRRIPVGLTVNVNAWTDYVFSDNQPGAVQRVTVCRQLDCGPDATSSITIPPDACPDPRYDGWMTAIDSGARIAYDYWRARCEADGSLSYHYVKAWELDGPGFQEPLGVSARGSGLPLFAGLITPEEIDSGRIEHALAISVPGAAQRKYVQPASRTDGTGTRASLPEGARIRLRKGAEKMLTRTFVRNGTQRETAMTIIDALERYGAIVVDRSAAPTLYAQRNADWMNILPLNLLQDIPLTRFDVVDLGKIFFDPPRSGEDELPGGTPGSIPSGASGSQGATGFGGTAAP